MYFTFNEVNEPFNNIQIFWDLLYLLVIKEYRGADFD